MIDKIRKKWKKRYSKRLFYFMLPFLSTIETVIITTLFNAGIGLHIIISLGLIISNTILCYYLDNWITKGLELRFKPYIDENGIEWISKVQFLCANNMLERLDTKEEYKNEWEYNIEPNEVVIGSEEYKNKYNKYSNIYRCTWYEEDCIIAPDKQTWIKIKTDWREKQINSILED